MGMAIGIDLGTTNSVAGFIGVSETAEVICSREGGRTIPSVFAVNSRGDRLVGKPAVDQEGKNAENTIRSVKRHMGTNERFTLGGKEMSPEEISAEILKKIKADCEAFFGEPVTQAVITVPAYFDNNQRTATKVAAELAGLEVLRIINEPTAAALAYGMDKKRDEKILVYDLGGGTFDVTVLEISTIGIFDVKSTAGDTRLGGDDFDDILMNLILDKHNYDSPVQLMRPGYYNNMMVRPGVELDLWIDSKGMARLRTAAEVLKRELSASSSAEIGVPYIASHKGEPIHIEVEISREEFEGAIAPLIARTKVCVDQALKDAKLTASDIDEVVFVGGSTRVPAIIAAVESWIGKKPNRSVNPDEAVALGAAVYASILSGAREANVILLDVTPLTLGVETLGGAMTAMIGRNTTIPLQVTEMFSTAEDNQKQVEIRVYQGERPLVRDNRFLGEFQLQGLPAMPRGVPQIDVTFEIDANGILSVTALERLTGVAQTVVITGSSSLSSDDIQRMLGDAELNRVNDERALEIIALRARLQDQLLQTEEMLRSSKPVLTAEIIEELEEAIPSLEDAINGENNMELMQSLALDVQETIKAASKLMSAKAQEKDVE